VQISPYKYTVSMPSKKKNVHLYSFYGDGTPFMPVLWPSAKTYYEKYGKYTDRFNWVVPIAEFNNDLDKIKKEIKKNPPDIFGVSLYVMKFELSLEVCRWVKEQYPNCIVLTGGPHQYFKFKKEWFVMHDFLDASLPSDVYGEIAMCDLLDHVANNKTVDWNQIEQIVYPLSFDRSVWMQSTKSTYKRLFKWDYSAYKEQSKHLQTYINEYNLVRTGRLSWKFETTRGCPYNCTFCDWGGGIGGKTLFKDVHYVKQDIDEIMKYNDLVIYVCDANFGIGGERDVEIIEYFANKKNELKSTISVYYGGFAKTNKHFDIIKRILEIEAKNYMSEFYKISVQSFDSEVLKNIKRTDLRKEEHWELREFLKNNYGYNSQVELIVGLPGITVDKWCEEFTVPYEKGVQVLAYEWHLLPESEAYDPVYRKKYGIQTSKKLMNKSQYHIPAELVVESSSYTTEDYKNMWTIYVIYMLFYRGGIYKNTVKSILEKNNMSFGQFLKRFLHECYPKLKQANPTSFNMFEEHLNYVVDKEGINDYRLYLKASFKDKPNQQIFFNMFLLMEYFTNFEISDNILQNWFIELGASKSLIEKENLVIVSENRINTTKFTWFKLIRYNRYQNFDDFAKELNDYTFYYPDVLLTKSTI
jgi:putative methyltransferase